MYLEVSPTHMHSLIRATRSYTIEYTKRHSKDACFMLCKLISMLPSRLRCQRIGPPFCRFRALCNACSGMSGRHAHAVCRRSSPWLILLRGRQRHGQMSQKQWPSCMHGSKPALLGCSNSWRLSWQPGGKLLQHMYRWVPEFSVVAQV